MANGKLQNIQAIIVSARNVSDHDYVPGAGVSDPVCECQVRGRPDVAFRTSVIKNSSNPIWNEGYEIAAVGASDVLVFTLYDYECGAAGYSVDGKIASASLPASNFLPGGFEGEIPLPNGGPGGSDAFLKVAVVVPESPSKNAVPAAAAKEQGGRSEQQSRGAPAVAASPPSIAASAGGATAHHAAAKTPADVPKQQVSDEHVREAMSLGIPKELDARVRTRAYFLWENGSPSGPDGDYFEALRAELLLSKLSKEPAVVVA